MLLLSKYKISGHSMEPSIENGSSVFVCGLSYLFKDPNINDVIAFKDSSGKILIKRIKKIENKLFFVEGDNEKDSLDSNEFGMIPRDRILGKLIYTLPAGRQEF